MRGEAQGTYCLVGIVISSLILIKLKYHFIYIYIHIFLLYGLTCSYIKTDRIPYNNIDITTIFIIAM